MDQSAPRSATAPGGIFVSYRRQDTAYAAGWLFERLADHYGRDQVFKDVDSLQLGDDFVARIHAAVGSCSALLALIGEDWLTVVDDTGRRRIDDPNDFVRVEIEAGLTRGVLVIPILVDGARMPNPTEVPVALRRSCDARRSSSTRRASTSTLASCKGSSTGRSATGVRPLTGRARRAPPSRSTTRVPLEHTSTAPGSLRWTGPAGPER